MKIEEIVGIDISKQTFDAFIESKELHSTFENTPGKFEDFKKWLEKNIGKDLSGVIIVMEHTGHYSYQLEQYLHAQELVFSKVGGLEIKRSLGLARGKSDKIDAKRIAEYGADKKKKLKVTAEEDKVAFKLKNLISLRDKLVRDKAGYQARMKEQQTCLGCADDDPLLKIQASIISSLEERVKELEEMIQQLIRSNEPTSKNYDLLTSIKGVGPVLATYTIAYTGNFTRFKNPRQFACFVGIAPFPYKSGTSVKGKTKVSPLANKKIKSILYLSASSAAQYNGELKAYYKRRLAEGKTEMSTLNVIRNKIVARMFAVVRKQNKYSAEIPTTKNLTN